MSWTNRKLSGAAFAALALALAALLISGSVRENAAAAVANPSAVSRPARAKGLHSLARVATAVDSSSAITDMAQHDPSIRLADVRRVAHDALGDVYLIPTTRGEICLGIAPTSKWPALGAGSTVDAPLPSLSMTCMAAADAMTHGIAGGLRGRYVGVAPDGVTSVRETSDSGSSVGLPLVNGVYHIDLGAKSVEFDVDGAKERLPLG